MLHFTKMLKYCFEQKINFVEAVSYMRRMAESCMWIFGSELLRPLPRAH